jgi:hypothetical protein
MPDNDPEPENYSIDDMMDRLRVRGGGPRDGEAKLVTREDGTQVYKMRKRKRRSHQPKKEKEKRDRRMRVAQVVGAVGLVAGAGLAFLGSVIYLNSPGYHRKIEERVRLWTGAEPKVSQLRISPVSAGASGVELRWPASSMLQSLSLNGMRADLRLPGLAGGTWKGTEMVAAHGGTLVLANPSGTPPALPARSGECPFQFRYRSSGFNVLMGDPEKPDARIHATEAILDVLDPGASTANLRFEGGILQAAGWGDFALKFASLQFEPDGPRVGNIRLSPGRDAGAAEIEIRPSEKGHIHLDGTKSEFPVRVYRMPIAALLGPGCGSWLQAEIETPDGGAGGTLAFQLGSPTPVTVRIPFRATASSYSSWKELGLFGVLAKEVRETWYQAPNFDQEFTGTVVRSGTASGLEEIRFSARNRITITGRLAVDPQGVLDGSLEVGLPEALVNESSAPFRAVFKRRDGGYSWATVRLSGNGRKPQDDLKQQLDAAATATAPAAGGNETLEDAFRELTTPER